MKYDVILGVDLGLHGAICIFDVQEGEILNIYDMPTYYTQGKAKTKSGKFREKGHIDLDKLLYILEMPQHQGDTTLLVMENVNTFPGQGVVSMGTLLEQKGILQGMGKALGYDIALLSPKVWQKHFDLVCPKTLKGKEPRKKWLKTQSRVKAIALFPTEWAVKFMDKNSHGRSDACLIAKFQSDMLNTLVDQP